MAQLLFAMCAFFSFFLTRNTVFFYLLVLLANVCPCGFASSFFSSVLFQSCNYRLQLAENKCYKYYLISRNFCVYKFSRIWGSLTKINPAKLQLIKRSRKFVPRKYLSAKMWSNDSFVYRYSQ